MRGILPIWQTSVNSHMPIWQTKFVLSARRAKHSTQYPPRPGLASRPHAIEASYVMIDDVDAGRPPDDLASASDCHLSQILRPGNSVRSKIGKLGELVDISAGDRVVGEIDRRSVVYWHFPRKRRTRNENGEGNLESSQATAFLISRRLALSSSLRQREARTTPNTSLAHAISTSRIGAALWLSRV